MFVGHLAVALLAKRQAPKVSLGTFLLAALLADLVVFPLLIAGIEHFDLNPNVKLNRFIGRDIVYSHSLLMTAVWTALFASVWWWRRRDQHGTWFLFGAGVSHWLLDFISHRPDMPLAPGLSPVFGLGLWNSLPATLIIEGGFWLLAVTLYLRATTPVKRAGTYAFWIGIALFTLLWFGNLTRGMETDPLKAGIGGLITFSLIAGWGYWMNRTRTLRT